jgi:O-acetylserine/cysteine efflux transporter
MKTYDRTAILSLAAAGVLWGISVPLTKLALGWVGPAWVTVVRFSVAAPLLGFASRRGLRGALGLRVVLAGALGFGAVVVLQNAGIARTSVTHAAVLVGAMPVIVAVIAAGIGDGRTRPRTWAGYAVALVGITLVAGSGGSGATTVGDLLVLASVGLSAVFVVMQPKLLAGRDAAAVTAVQFAAGGLVALPVALITGHLPSAAPSTLTPVIALVALTLVGVPAALAGVFVNLEPLVGAAVGWIAFGDVATSANLVGAFTVLAGIALSVWPASAAAPPRRRYPRSQGRPRTQTGQVPASTAAMM